MARYYVTHTELKLNGPYRAGEYRVFDRDSGNELGVFRWDESSIRQARDSEWMVDQGAAMRAAYDCAAQYERGSTVEAAYRRRK